MPIVSTDIKYRLSGGASNANPLLSLGGAISSVDASATIYDNVTSAEAQSGDVEYRCIYVRNNHGSLTALGARVWIQTNTAAADTSVDIGMGTAAVSATEQVVANESTPPTGVTFVSAANEGVGLNLGDLAPGQFRSVWMRRTVNASAGASNDNFTLRTKCDTLP